MAVYVEGKPAKMFEIYELPDKLVAEYATIAQVLAHHWRLDRQYTIGSGGKYFTKPEFEEWAKQQKT